MTSSKLLRPLLLILLLALCPQPQAQDDDLLPPEQAFALSAWVDGDILVAEYRIAPGYYMYRERFAFEHKDKLYFLFG